MRSIPLGPNAPPVTVIGYGGMHVSIDGRPPEEQGVQVIHAALDAGETLIDTADVYCLDHTDIGHNERLIARALSTWKGRRESILVATKGGMTRPQGRWERDGSPRHLREACDRSLKALGVPRIDLYQLHAPDHQVRFEDSVGTLAELQKAGKIRWVGLSNVSVDEIKKAEAIVPITSVQNRLNPFFREALADGVVAYCASRGIGFLAYSPTGGGRLTRKIPQIPVLQTIARRLGVSPHQVCLAWVLRQGATVIAIPSSRTIEHAVDGARSADVTLTAEDLRAIDAAEFSRA
jgi:aryl-alcohol dehydrogenase-like predicted oxidoreductase